MQHHRAAMCPPRRRSRYVLFTWPVSRVPASLGLRRVLVRRRQLPQGMVSRNLKAMEVHFTPEQEAQLSEIATKAGTDPERLVKDATLRLLEEDVRFRAAVARGHRTGRPGRVHRG